MEHLLPHSAVFKARLPSWLLQASAEARDTLKALTLHAQRCTDALNSPLSALPAIRTFALEQLQPGLSTTFGMALDAEATVLARSYRVQCVPPQSDLDPNKSVGDLISLFCPTDTVRNTLLHAALGNYPTAVGFNVPEEAFSLEGHPSLDASRFVALVYQLDIGSAYQARLAELLPEPAEPASGVQAAYSAWAAAALAVAAFEAQLQGTLSAAEVAQLNAGLPVHGVELFGKPLHGLWACPLGEQWLLYQPTAMGEVLKGYASEQALQDDLVNRLKQPKGRAALLRCAALAAQPHLADQLNANLGPATPGAAEAPPSDAERSVLQWAAATQPSASDAYGAWRGLLLANAATVAVPASDLRQQAHERFIARLVNDAEQVLFTAAMLVPGCQPLGLAALAVFVHGIADQVYEGYHAWQLGDREQATELLFNTAANLAAGVLAQRLSSRFAGQLQVLGDAAEARLWKPEPAAYGAPADVTGEPDTDGLYSAAGRRWLALEGRAYPVRGEATELQLAVPANQVAAAPELEPALAGGWQWAHNEPLGWQGIHLLRQFSELADTPSDALALRAWRLSQVPEPELRYARANDQPLPAALAYWLRRAGLRQALGEWAMALEAHGQAPVNEPEALIQLLSVPQWPARVGLDWQLGEAQGQLGDSAEVFVRVDASNLQDGRWHAELLAAMSPAERQALAGEGDSAEQGAALARQWATQLRAHLPQVLERALRGDSLYERGVVVLRAFPGLPTEYAQALVEGADSAERTALAAGKVPQVMAEQAVRALRRLRVARALEALDAGEPGDDRDRLFMANLARLPNWPATLRLRLTSNSYVHTALGDAGPEAAPLQHICRFEGVYRRELGGEFGPPLPLEQAVYESLPADTQAAWAGSEGVTPLSQRVQALAWEDLPRARADLAIQPEQAATANLPRRLNGGIGYALSGRPRMPYPAGHSPLLWRLGRLYPGLGRAALSELQQQLQLSQPRPLTEIVSRLEAQWTTLDRGLRDWQRNPANNMAQPALREAQQILRQRMAEALRACWRRESLLAGHNAELAVGLDLSFFDIGELPPLAVDLSHVQILRLSGLGLNDGFEAFLSTFTGAREVSLDYNLFTRLPSALGRMPNLEWLNVANTALEGSDTLFDGLVAGAPNLATLDVSGVPSLPEAALRRLGELAHLQVLRWDRAAGVDDAQLAAIGQLTALRRLSLEQSGIRLSAASQGFLRPLQHLKVLNLNGNPLGLAPDLTGLAELSELQLDGTLLEQPPEGLVGVLAARPPQLYRIDLSNNQIRQLGELLPALEGCARDGYTITVELDENPVQAAEVAALEAIDVVISHHADQWIAPAPAVQRAVRQVRGVTLGAAFLDWISALASRNFATKRRWTAFLGELLDSNQQFASERASIATFEQRLRAFQHRLFAQIYDPIPPTLRGFERQLAAFRAAQQIDIVQGDDPYDALLRHLYDLWQGLLRERYGAEGVQPRTQRGAFVEFLLERQDELSQIDLEPSIAEQDWRPYLNLIDPRWTTEAERWDAALGVLEDAASEPVDAGQLPVELLEQLQAPSEQLPRAWLGLGAPADVVEPVDDVAWRVDGVAQTVQLTEDQYRRAAQIYRRTRLWLQERLAREITEAAVTPWWEPVEE